MVILPNEILATLDDKTFFKGSLHLYYGSRVVDVKDGLNKFADLPKDFGGSGKTID
jgi:hypothetical protein